jgi:short-subunit dehydrogenase
MNAFLNKYGQRALVAGSAEGLGEAYSRALARKKVNTVMVDRQHELLSNLSREMEFVHGIKTIRVHLDLATKDAPEVMMDAIKDLDCRLLVYNAAFSMVKPFLKNSPEDLDNYVNVNARTLIQTALPFAEKCKAAGGGGILVMSSPAARTG